MKKPKPVVGADRKADLRDDVDALAKSVAEVRATVEDIFEIIKGQLRESRDAVRALEGLGGRPPLRVLDMIVGRDPYTGVEGKRLTVHWTPMGLILFENGKRFETQSYHHVVEAIGPMPSLRGFK